MCAAWVFMDALWIASSSVMDKRTGAITYGQQDSDFEDETNGFRSTYRLRIAEAGDSVNLTLHK